MRDMPGYYSEQLTADRLQRCYQLATPRVRQYLNAEIDRVATVIRPSDCVLELGCGYGRVMVRVTDRAGTLIGVDTSLSSLLLARHNLCDRTPADAHAGDSLQTSPNERASERPNQYRDRKGAAGRTESEPRSLHRWEGTSIGRVIQMDAGQLAFRDDTFDVVICIQNGLSAINVDPHVLMREAVRVTRPGGRALFSSYAEAFWPHRLEWFRIQADHGLIGPIDESATGDGVIVCTDGFRATTIGPDELHALAANLDVMVDIQEVDGSSVFCELVKPRDCRHGRLAAPTSSTSALKVPKHP